LFLYNYAAELNYIKEYEQSLMVLKDCILYLNDYEVQLLIADNYFNLNNYHKAIPHYRLASEMCPNRFIPLEKLSQIYERMGDFTNLERVIDEILNKQVKINSSAVIRIKTDAKKKKMEINLNQ
jgi:tetratricopeptide (TPR) repeat protein